MNFSKSNYTEIIKVCVNTNGLIKSKLHDTFILYPEILNIDVFDNCREVFRSYISFFFCLFNKNNKENLEFIKVKISPFDLALSESINEFQNLVTAFEAVHFGTAMIKEISKEKYFRTINYWFLKNISKLVPENNEDWCKSLEHFILEGKSYLEGIYSILCNIETDEHKDIFVFELKNFLFESRKKVASVIFMDIEGYSLKLSDNENNASSICEKFHLVIKKQVVRFNGEIINFRGDGCLLLFNSISKACDFSVECQKLFSLPLVVPVRVGIHTGEVYVDEESAYGDSVNIASRIQSLSIAGGIYISEVIFLNIKNNSKYTIEYVDDFKLKNIAENYKVYRIIPL